jgi:hypothetical protein
MAVQPDYDPKAADRFHSFLRGFRDGVAGRPEDPNFTGCARDDIRSAYATGLLDGCTAVERAAGKAQKRYRYKPSILRGGEG